MKIIYFFIIVFCLFSNKIYSYSIVASILPLQSLTAMVTENIADVQLIFNPNVSPHDMELTYQKSSLIHKSNFVVIVSKDFEKVIYNAVPNKNNLIIMLNAPHINTINYTNSLVLQDVSFTNVNDNSVLDPHIWLDPNNAIAFLNYLATELALRDPTHAKQYHTNAAKYIKLLTKLNASLQNTTNLKRHNFLIYHNGYNYLINNFNLNHNYKGYIAKHSHDDSSISVKALITLQKFIKANNVSCILMEQNLPDSTIQKFIQDNKLKTGRLNAIGNYNPPEKIQNVYFNLISSNVQIIQNCISN